jgi:hypothetical protein
VTYYERLSAEHLDGTPIFTSAADVASEGDVAVLMERAWSCDLHRFGLLCPVDWYATRAGRLVGVLELKTRTHAAATFPTVFLNVRKWLALSMAAWGLGVPALFVVRFTDGVRWCRVQDVNARVHRVAGCARRVKSASDVEPVIEVAVEAMTALPVTRESDEPNG